MNARAALNLRPQVALRLEIVPTQEHEPVGRHDFEATLILGTTRRTSSGTAPDAREAWNAIVLFVEQALLAAEGEVS